MFDQPTGQLTYLAERIGLQINKLRAEGRMMELYMISRMLDGLTQVSTGQAPRTVWRSQEGRAQGDKGADADSGTKTESTR